MFINITLYITPNIPLFFIYNITLDVMPNITTDLLIFVERGKIRKQVLSKLGEREQVAFLLAKSLGTHRETVSRVFNEFADLKLAECVNSEDHHFRKYRITKLGRELLKEL